MITQLSSYHRISFNLLIIVISLILGTLTQASAAQGKQRSFSSPDVAIQKFFSAVKNNDVKRLNAIFGPDGESLISSGDTIADSVDRKEFVRQFEAKHTIEFVGDDKVVLSLGLQDHPFPIPLIKTGKRWIFSTSSGREEILNRRIGSNELNAISVAKAYVVAQREYAAKDRDHDGLNAFAQRFRSEPGTNNGLYWETAAGEPESPFGPLIAEAAVEGYGSTAHSDTPAPFRGYIFKILKAQGANAEGGAFDYVVNGKMVLGFALVAYPAQYGSSGITTFIVNQGGTIYQKDLGPATDSAAAMAIYDPDASWKKLD